MHEALTSLFDMDSLGDVIWVGIGLIGQLLFTGRFVLQWLASEKAKRSVMPVTFWYFSIGGALILLAYAIHRGDIVFTLGQSFGVIVYARNLWLIRAERRTVS